MGVKEWIGGVGMVIVFAIALLYFMTSFITTNNPDGLSSDVAYLNNSLAELNQRAQALKDYGENAKDLLSAETPSSVFIFLIIKSAFTIPFSFLAFLVSGVISVITITFTSLFGVGATQFYIVFAVVNGLAVIGIVFAILKAIRLGQVER